MDERLNQFVKIGIVEIEGHWPNNFHFRFPSRDDICTQGVMLLRVWILCHNLYVSCNEKSKLLKI